jgi:hypothetical protein
MYLKETMCKFVNKIVRIMAEYFKSLVSKILQREISKEVVTFFNE